MTSWRSGLLPTHQNFQSLGASGSHSSFVDCSTVSNSAHLIFDAVSQIASFTIYGLAPGSSIAGFVTGAGTEQITIVNVGGGTFSVFIIGAPTVGDVLTLGITDSLGNVTYISTTVGASDNITTLAATLSANVTAGSGALQGQAPALFSTLASSAAIGAVLIHVVGASSFVIGQQIIIDPGQSDQQVITLTGYQSPDILTLAGSLLHAYAAGTPVQGTSIKVVSNPTPVDAGPGTPSNPTLTVSPVQTVTGGGQNGATPNNSGVKIVGDYLSLVSNLDWLEYGKAFAYWQDGCNMIYPLGGALFDARPASELPYTDLACYQEELFPLIPPGFASRFIVEAAGSVGLDGNQYWSGRGNLNRKLQTSWALWQANPDLMSLFWSTASSMWAMADMIPGIAMTLDNSTHDWWAAATQPDYNFGAPPGNGQITNLTPVVWHEPLNATLGDAVGGGGLWVAARQYMGLKAWPGFGVVASTPWDTSGPLYLFDVQSLSTSGAVAPYDGFALETGSFGASSLNIGSSRAMASTSPLTPGGYFFVASSSGSAPQVHVFDAPQSSPLYTITLSGTSCITQVIPIAPSSFTAKIVTQPWPSSLFTTGSTTFTATVIPPGLQYVSGAPQGAQFQRLSDGSTGIIFGAPLGTTGVYLSPGSWTAQVASNFTGPSCLAFCANGDAYYIHTLSGNAQKLDLGGTLVQWAAVDMSGNYLYIVPMGVLPLTNDGNAYSQKASNVQVYQLFGASQNAILIRCVHAGSLTPSLYSSAGRNPYVFNVSCSPNQPYLALQCSDDILICPTGEVDAGIT